MGSAVLNALEIRGYPVVRKTAFQVIDDYCEVWRVPNLYRTIPVLFIDEMGKERPDRPLALGEIDRFRESLFKKLE